MTTIITNAAARQDFAAIRDSYFRAYETLTLRCDDIDMTANKGDPAEDAYSAAAWAIREATAPDFAAVIDKLHVVMMGLEASQEDSTAKAVASIISDVAALAGEPAFNPAAWLCRWVDFDGGYIVQDGRGKLLCPAGTANATRERLLKELDDLDGREALDAYILAWAGDGPHIETATDFDTLKQAVADAYAKAEDRSNTEDETNQATDAYNAALQALMAYPATNGAQLAYKLKTFRDLECNEYREDILNPMLDAFEADARRIGGAA